jgi:hypothetical protein
VFCFLEAGRIAEFLAVGTPHLIRGVIRVHIGNVGQKGIMIVEKIRANSKFENKQSWFQWYGRAGARRRGKRFELTAVAVVTALATYYNISESSSGRILVFCPWAAVQQ